MIFGLLAVLIALSYLFTLSAIGFFAFASGFLSGVFVENVFNGFRDANSGEKEQAQVIHTHSSLPLRGIKDN